MFRIFACLPVVLFLLSCAQEQKAPLVVNIQEVEPYLQADTVPQLSKCDTEIRFWKKRTPDLISLSKIGSLYASRFKLSGEVQDILISDSIFNELANSPYGKTSEIYHMLAANAITQHQFRKAENYIRQAYEIGNNKPTTLLMSIDINLELGNLDMARDTLKKFTNRNSFACLIRRSKLKDHEGDLDSAILLMQMAVERAGSNKSLLCWAKSNLADMYGHAGMISESYQAHLEVLKLNPTFDHSLKSIAWIAFSHDKNPAIATYILSHLQLVRPIPDYNFLLAQIARFENDQEKEYDLLKKYVDQTSKEEYGGMYAKYLAILKAEKFSSPQETIELAQEEIMRRPCPQSYDLLGWGYYHAGEPEKALEVIQNYVEEVTFEPEALYHMGIIYKANGMTGKARELLKEAKESAFELGPEVAGSIEQALVDLGA